MGRHGPTAEFELWVSGLGAIGFRVQDVGIRGSGLGFL